MSKIITLDRLSDFLTNLKGLFVTKTDAESTYATKEELNSAKTIADDTYESKTDAATHLTKTEAAETYVTKAENYNVYNKTLTIQKNGTNVATFTSNSNTDVTANISVPTKTSDLTNDSGFITGASLLPIGSYIQFAGSQAPAGFLVCNGGAISRTTYSKLFAVIGTKYGSGNGSTTFNLPNLTDRFLQGSTTSGTVKNAGLPNITGAVGCFRYPAWIGTVPGACRSTPSGSTAGLTLGPDGETRIVTLNASWSNSIYGSSSTVQPPALTCLICIKY